MTSLLQRIASGELSRGFLVTLVAIGISALSSFAQAFILSSHMGLALFGVVAFVQALAILVAALCNPNSFQPLIIHLSHDGSDESKAALVKFCSRLDMGFGLVSVFVFAAVGALCAWWLPMDGVVASADLWQMFLLYAPLVWLLILQNSAVGYFRSQGRFGFLAKVKAIFAVVTLLLVIGIAMQPDVRVMDAYYALLAVLIGRGGEFIYIYASMRRELPATDAPLRMREQFAQHPELKAGLWNSYVQNLSLNILETADVFLAGVFFGAQEAGIIRLIRTVTSALSLPVIALRQVALTMISAMVVAGKLVRLRLLAIRFSILVMLAISFCLLLVLWGEPWLRALFVAQYDVALPPYLLPLFLLGCGLYYSSSLFYLVTVSRHKNKEMIGALLWLTACYGALMWLGHAVLGVYVFAAGYVLFYTALNFVTWRQAWR